MKKYFSIRVTLGAIFLLAFILRIYKLGSIPFNFHEDEVLTGYVGRYILLNGKDIYNNPWPLLYFNKFGDYYIILPMYIKGLFTFIFGVNEFAVRFPTALIGALAIIPVYYFSEWIFRNKTIATLSAFLLAVTPWHIVLSRADAEGVMGSTLFLGAIALIVRWVDVQEKKYLIMGCILYLICYFIYHPFRILVPLSVLPLPFLIRSVKTKRTQFITAAVVAIVFFALTIYISSTVWGSGRFQQTSIFSPLSGVSIKIQELIFDEGQGNILTAKIFHNKAIGYGREFLHQYFSYFSPEFLFISGGKSYAYRVYEHGLYYFSWIILLTAALYYLHKTNIFENKRIAYFLYLLALAPIPAGMTVLDAPNVHRSVIMSLFLAILFAFGLYQIVTIKNWRKPIISFVVLVFIVEFSYFWHQYTVHSDLFNGLYRNDSQKQVVQYLDKKVSKKTPVYMQIQRTMPLYYLFYTNDFDPKYATQIGFDIKINKINNVTFVDSDCPSQLLAGKKLAPDTVIIDSQSCVGDARFEMVEKIQGVNPLMAFKVLKIRVVPTTTEK